MRRARKPPTRTLVRDTNANGLSVGRLTRSRVSRRLCIAACALVLAGIASSLSAAETAPTPTCPRQVNDGHPGAKVDPPITLTPTPQSAQRQVNFDTDRSPMTVPRLVVTADGALGPDVTPDKLSYDAILSRTGDTLESASFPTPTFTDPQIRADRKTIIFSACLNPATARAGKYVGSLELSGPDGISAASINLTVNLKDGHVFWYGLVFALIMSFLLLLLKDAAAAYPGKNNNWGQALLVPITDLRWWAATLIALGGAFGVLYAAFANDPAWGATGLAAASALVGSAFAAIGGQSILTSFSTPK